MRIVVHDFGSYHFPVQLSRELANLGHDVLHLFSDLTTPKGFLWKDDSDVKNFDLKLISINEKHQKYKYFQRWKQSRIYGHAVAAEIKAYKPDIVFSCNSDLETSSIIQKSCKRMLVTYVDWTMDVDILAIRSVISKKVPIIGPLIYYYFWKLQKSLIENSDAVIFISNDFEVEFRKLSITPKRIYEIQNWSPNHEIKPGKKSNPWSIRHNLDNTFNILYTGRLSLSHNENIFLEMSKYYLNNPNIRIIVAASGIGFDNLVEKKKSNPILENLILLGWQKYEDLSDILATGDILVATVNSDASSWAVPSKVMSYLSAGRSILAIMPENNLVARILRDSKIGLIANPADIESVINGVETLYCNSSLMEEMSAKSRQYAIENFDIKIISKKFENIIFDLVQVSKIVKQDPT